MKAIVFVLRGCSASWLGAYGNEWIATPNLDRFAAEGVVFDRHISNCPDLTAACRAWLSGEATSDHSSANKEWDTLGLPCESRWRSDNTGASQPSGYRCPRLVLR